MENATLKTISILATGDELINGDIQDANSLQFAKTLSEQGACLYQHLQASDKKQDIISGLRYLLSHSQAVITTGGLGPTSDDNTRFAIAEVIQQELKFNEMVWEDIIAHFKRRNFPMAESNRQQALFPETADLYQNLLGTAWGCHIAFDNKHIFMLPGPPKECVPLFENHVIKDLDNFGFLQQKHIYRFLTTGLIEGSIATEIDAMVKPYGLETGYRAFSPYLEIKVISYGNKIDDVLLATLHRCLGDHMVSFTIPLQKEIEGLR
jgi:nicotinamide-nucleotide amidase